MGNVSFYTSMEELIRRYGEPSFVGTSADGMERSLNFSKYARFWAKKMGPDWAHWRKRRDSNPR